MIRVVIDTNIVVSALLQPLGPPAQILTLALSASIQRCVSGSIYAEYEEVIRRPRFQRSEEIVAGTLQAIRERAVWVRHTERVTHARTRMTIFFWNAPRQPRRNI